MRASKGVRGRGGLQGQRNPQHSDATGLTVEALERRRLLSAGDLDPGFGAGGMVTVPNFVAKSVAVQPDGKLLVAGSLLGSANVAVCRLLPTGSPDPSFGTNGLATGIAGSSLRPTSVLLQPDGKILEAACTDYGYPDGIALIRYNADGTLDSSFAAGGIARPASNLLGTCERLALQPDGRILVAGARQPAGVMDSDSAIARFNTDGTLDASFGSGGTYVIGTPGTADRADSIYVYPDGTFLAAGWIGDYGRNNLWVTKFNADGTQHGVTISSGVGLANTDQMLTDFDVRVAVQSDGKVIVGGRTAGIFLAMRFAADLSQLDTTFGTNGSTRIGSGAQALTGAGMSLTTAGQIVMAGSYGTDAAVARFNVNGAGGDGSFGADGVAHFALGANNYFNDVAILPDNSLVAVGVGASGGVIAHLDGGGPASLPDVQLSPTGALTFNGTRGADNLHLSLAGGVYTATFNGLAETFDASSVTGVSATLGGGADTVLLDGLTCGGTVDLGDGANVITVNAAPSGSAGWAITGGAGNDTLNVTAGAPAVTFDGGAGQGDAVAFTGSASADTITGSGTAVTGAAGGAPISVSYANVESVSLFGGAGDDTIVANGDAQRPFYLSGDDGNDSVTFHAPAGALPATLHGGAGNDALLVDAGLSNPVVATGDAGTDTITVKGTAGDDVITATAWKVNAVQYSATNLVVDADAGNDSVTLVGTNYSYVTLMGGSGDDRLAFTEQLYYDDLYDSAAFDGGPGYDTLLFDDHLHTGNWNYSLQPNTHTTAPSFVMSVAPSNSTYVPTATVSNVEATSLLTGGGADSIGVSCVPAGTTLSVDGGAGDDSMSVSGASVLGPVTVHGRAGNNTLSVSNTLRATSETVTVTTTQVGLAPGDNIFATGVGVTYDGIAALTVKTGTGSDVIRVAPGAATAITVNGANPTTTPGDRLIVDASGLNGAQQTVTGTGAGTFTFSNAKAVTYSAIESASAVTGPEATAGSLVPAADGSGVGSFSITFSADVGSGLTAADLQVQDLTTGATVASSALAMAYDAGSHTATWTFPGLPGGVLGPSAYRLTLPAGSTADPQGNPLLSDTRFDVVPVHAGGQPAVQWQALRAVLDPSGLLLSVSPDAQYSLTTPSGATVPTLTVSAGTVALTDDLSRTFAGGAPVQVTGGQLVLLGSQTLTSLSISGGAVSLGGGVAATLTLSGALSITGGGTLDLGSGSLLLPTTTNIAAYIAQAAGPAQPNGLNAWAGAGLTSNLVRGDAANGNAKQLALGYFDSRDNGQTGLSVAAGKTLVQVTVYGDATGDGKVTIADLSVWNNNFGASSPRWSQGDFNYDGKVNIADLSVWNNDFGNSVGTARTAAPAPSPVASVNSHEVVAQEPSAATPAAVTVSAAPSVQAIDAGEAASAAGPTVVSAPAPAKPAASAAKTPRLPPRKLPAVFSLTPIETPARGGAPLTRVGASADAWRPQSLDAWNVHAARRRAPDIGL